MTPNQITAQIAESLKRPLDMPFRLLLGDKLKVWRGTFIRRTLQKHPQEENTFVDSITLPMIPMNFTCDGTVCQGSISEVEVPMSIRVNDKMWSYLGSTDGSNAWEPASAGFTSFAKESRFPKIIYEYVNGRIRVHSRVKKVRIDMIPDDPEAIALLKCSFDKKSNDCDYWNSEFPAPSDILQQIIQAIIQIDFNQSKPIEQEIPV